MGCDGVRGMDPRVRENPERAHAGAVALSSAAMTPSPRSSFLIAMLLTAVALASSHPCSDDDDTRGSWLRGTFR